MAVGWRKLSSAIASEQELDETGTIVLYLIGLWVVQVVEWKFPTRNRSGDEILDCICF